MRALIILLALVALSGCATLRDPNIETLTKSAETQNTQIAQIYAARETARADAYTACMNSPKADANACAVSNIAMFGGGGGGGSMPQVILPNYQRPPTPTEQFTGVLGQVVPGAVAMGNAYANIVATKENARTQRVIAETNAQREVGIVNAFSEFGRGAVDAFARLPPSSVTTTTITAAGDLVQGNGNTLVRGQIGDRAGHDMGGGDVGNGIVNNGRDVRLDSPGPYVGPICTGDGCQRTETPVAPKKPASVALPAAVPVSK